MDESIVRKFRASTVACTGGGFGYAERTATSNRTSTNESYIEDNFFLYDPDKKELKYVFEMLIPYLLSKLENVIVSVVCWTRFVQILIMGVVSPVTLCDFGDHPSQSNAMRGAKNIVALSFSGPLILLSMFICREIQLQIMTSATASLTASSYVGAIWSMSVIAIVQISLVTRSTNLAKQALGMA